MDLYVGARRAVPLLCARFLGFPRNDKHINCTEVFKEEETF
jgi:hypothetical protein